MQPKNVSPQRRTVRRQRSIDGFTVRPTHHIRQNNARTTQLHMQAATVAQVISMPTMPVIMVPELPDNITHTAQTHHQLPKKLLLAAASIVLVGSFLVLNHLAGNHQTTAKAAALPLKNGGISKQQSAEVSAPATPLVDIAGDMNAIIASQTGLQASATLIDLNTNKTYNAGDSDEPYTAASTSKLVAVFDYLHQVELGKASLGQNIGGMTAQQNIMRMIVYSDNDAWARLNRYLTFKGEQAYMDSLRIPATIQENNMQFSTPNMARLLQLLYAGKLMNATNQAMIYDYMAHTTVKNLIQAALPADVTVYHKYGQIMGVLHDASIVEYQGHRFVLVVYTNNPSGTTTKNAQQVALIQAVTKAAFADITKP